MSSKKLVKSTICKREGHRFLDKPIVWKFSDGSEHAALICEFCGTRKYVRWNLLELDRPPIRNIKHRKNLKTGFSGDRFYKSQNWLKLRYQVIRFYGGSCMACGIEGSIIHVDHIKPRSKYPELALEFSNLQILCMECNIGKSNEDETDWRPKPSEVRLPKDRI